MKWRSRTINVCRYRTSLENGDRLYVQIDGPLYDANPSLTSSTRLKGNPA